ncbi:MAG: hypothetical protein RLZZ223_469 [Candidatus Parcubacteria bacterium]|jgi:prepilin-type N-terminal cleavage/methylation domain-containing protein
MKKFKSGFTLIEVSLVIVLISIIIAITTPLAIDTVVKVDLNAAHESLYGALLRAQKLSRIQDMGQDWKVCIDNNNKAFKIVTGECNNPDYSETLEFASHILVTSSPSLDISFAAIDGKPLNGSNNTSFNITLSSRSNSKTININEAGIINKTVNN